MLHASDPETNGKAMSKKPRLVQLDLILISGLCARIRRGVQFTRLS